MRTKIYLILFYISWLFLSLQIANSQELPTTKSFSPADTSTNVEILSGVKKLEYRKIDSITEVQILVGNVRLKQGNSFFSCDSCVINKRLNLFEAWGSVHIIDSDTINVYSDFLRYLTDKKIAYLTKNVKLTDGKGTLTTQNMEYDVNTKVGIYKKGGKVVSKKTVLTSDEGIYYADLKDVYFRKNVFLKDPSYTLKSDSLLYNTRTEISRFISETIIKDSSNRTVHTKDGFYNPKMGKAEFNQRPLIIDGSIRATGNKVISDDSSGITQFYGNAIFVDTAESRTVIAGEVFINKKTESFLASKNPLMILKQENDSIFVAADTLFSSKLSALYLSKDTINKKEQRKKINDVNKTDSTNRYFEAYRNVRIFNDSLQAVCDSLFYSYQDSTFRLFKNPVVWAKENQIFGDTILLFTKNNKAEKMDVFKNSFIISRVQAEIYNQIKSVRLNAFFKNGTIDSVRARGLANCIYFIQDQDSAFTGINQSAADIIDIFFREGELNRIVFRSEVQGTIWPIQQKKPEEMRLPNFKWMENRRPKTKYELFEQ